MPKKTTPGPHGTIWSEGVHHVFVDQKPARVKVTQATIPEAYNKFKDEIEAHNGIQIGIDHIPDDLLDKYPILAKLDPHNVGVIREVETDGNRVYATRTEHTNPLIAELYRNGELTDYSVVASSNLDVAEGDDADYIFNSFKTIRRMDYVDEGGCQACKVGSVPDDLILTAKLSMEVDKLTNEENTQNEIEQTEETTSIENTSEETNTQQEQEQEQTEETKEVEYVTKEAFDTVITQLKDLFKTPAEDVKVEARLADLEKKNQELELEAQKNGIETKINKKISEGTVIPAMKEGLLQAGLSMKEEDFDKHLDTYKEKLVDMEQHGHLEAGNSTDEYTFETYKKRRENIYNDI